LKEPVSHGTSHSFQKAEDAESDELAKSLFEVGDVESVFYMDKMITVEKSDEVEWDEILPLLAVPIRRRRALLQGTATETECLLRISVEPSPLPPPTIRPSA
jgi:hypothetical protein